VTILGDLTQDVKYYERAWSLSKGRYARAKRTWAHVCFDKGDFHGCYAHMCDALAVQPFVNKAWYLKGVACMQLPKWDEALEAFHRCVNLDADVAEAWANMGAVHLKTGYPERALISLEEAMRRKRGCFKIQENILAASLQSGAFDRCLRCMEYLLQLRHKSKTNYYPAELRHLAMAVVEDKHLDLVNKMETFFVSVASAISPDAVYWDIRANFYLALTRPRDAVDCRVKHIRAVLATERWAYDGTLIALMSTAITCLRARVQESEAMSTDKTLLYTCHSLCKSAVQSARGIERDVDEVRNITALLSENQDYFDETMRGVE
jgi:tetratricopeptide (TPR) repeat protein